MADTKLDSEVFLKRAKRIFDAWDVSDSGWQLDLITELTLPPVLPSVLLFDDTACFNL